MGRVDEASPAPTPTSGKSGENSSFEATLGTVLHMIWGCGQRYLRRQTDFYPDSGSRHSKNGYCLFHNGI